MQVVTIIAISSSAVVTQEEEAQCAALPTITELLHLGNS